MRRSADGHRCGVNRASLRRFSIGITCAIIFRASGSGITASFTIIDTERSSISFTDTFGVTNAPFW